MVFPRSQRPALSPKQQIFSFVVERLPNQSSPERPANYADWGVHINRSNPPPPQRKTFH